MNFVPIQTTLPHIDDRSVHFLQTERLIMRPLLYPADLEAFRTIRSQPAAMTSSRTGLPDDTLEQTANKLERIQPPFRQSHVYFGIFLRQADNGTEAELIGDGGVHEFLGTATGWPEFGYKLKQEHWGRGYATEFAKAFLHFWWELPRVERRVQVAASSLMPHVYNPLERLTSHIFDAPEQVTAWTKVDNVASQSVLRKAGFKAFEGLENGFVNWRITSPNQYML